MERRLRCRGHKSTSNSKTRPVLHFGVHTFVRRRPCRRSKIRPCAHGTGGVNPRTARAAGARGASACGSPGREPVRNPAMVRNQWLGDLVQKWNCRSNICHLHLGSEFIKLKHSVLQLAVDRTIYSSEVWRSYPHEEFQAVPSVSCSSLRTETWINTVGIQLQGTE